MLPRHRLLTGSTPLRVLLLPSELSCTWGRFHEVKHIRGYTQCKRSYHRKILSTHYSDSGINMTKVVNCQNQNRKSDSMRTKYYSVFVWNYLSAWLTARAQFTFQAGANFPELVLTSLHVFFWKFLPDFFGIFFLQFFAFITQPGSEQFSHSYM